MHFSKVILLLLSSVLTTAVWGQERLSPIRVNSVVDLDFVQEEILGPIYLRFNDLSIREKPRIAIRLCTADPIHLALVKSALYFPNVIKSFESIGYSGDKLLILRSDKCVSELESVVSTEVWTVFSNQDLPPHNEKYYSSQIDVAVISRTLIKYAGNANYLYNASILANQLKNDQSKVGVIIGLFRLRPNESNKKMVAIRRVLERAGIEKTRYHLREFPWRQALSPDALPKGSLSPAFFTVDIHKNRRDPNQVVDKIENELSCR